MLFLPRGIWILYPLSNTRFLASLHYKRHLDRFSRFCTAHDCTQDTDTQTTKRATSVPHLHTACERCGLLRVTKTVTFILLFIVPLDEYL